MPRPQKSRRVAFLPEVTYFKPAGVPMRVLSEVVLSMEEVEAIRLKDFEGLEQAEAAEKMNISRPTFQRMLTSARQKIADALNNGKAIKIAGGNYEVSPLRFRCLNGHEWDVPFENAVKASQQAQQACTVCSSTDMTPLEPFRMGYRQHKGSGRYRRGRRGS